MYQLLFIVLFAEGAVAFLLMLKIGPLRELVMRALDQVKMVKGPVMAIAGTMSMILLSSVISILKIQNKGSKLGTMTPMDQVLWRTHLLEASLIGFCLFLGFIVDRMHHYLKKLNGLRGTVGSLRKDVDELLKEKKRVKEAEEVKLKKMQLLQKEIGELKENTKKLRLESEEKDKRVETAESQVASLHKQSADLLLEYDRLLEDNQNLQILVGQKS